MTVVALVARITSVAGREVEVTHLLEQFAAEVRHERGNLQFAAHQTVDDHRVFIVYEEYADAAAFASHLVSEQSLRFNNALAPLVVGGRSELTTLKPLGGGQNEAHD